MPTTINSVGTKYFGKKDLEIHVGVCGHCGKEVELQAFETRLWFVILFLPPAHLSEAINCRTLDRGLEYDTMGRRATTPCRSGEENP
jgi:hypothetical protein